MVMCVKVIVACGRRCGCARWATCLCAVCRLGCSLDCTPYLAAYAGYELPHVATCLVVLGIHDNHQSFLEMLFLFCRGSEVVAYLYS